MGWTGRLYLRGALNGRARSYSGPVGRTGASVGTMSGPRWRRVHPLRGPGGSRHRASHGRLGGPARRAALRLGAAHRRRDGGPGAALLDAARRCPRARWRRPSTSRRTSRSSPRSGGTSPSRVFRWSSSAAPATCSRSWPTAATCRSARTRWRRWAGRRARAIRTAGWSTASCSRPLTDLFAMPAWMPVANVFSVGDVLIGVGAAIAIVAAMHGRGPRSSGRRDAASPDAPGTPGTPAGASLH